jgi:RimJ/RimL family protein N-acetyltransferase
MPAPVLETKRLVLRHLSEDDAPFVLGLLNEPSFLQFIGDRKVRTVDQAREYLRTGPILSYATNGFGLLLVVRKSDGEPLGICGLLKRETLDDVDIGFAFRPAFWLKGYAVESASAVLAYGLNVLGFARIVAITNPGNAGSIAVLEALGLRFERMMRLSDDEPELKLFAIG